MAQWGGGCRETGSTVNRSCGRENRDLYNSRKKVGVVAGMREGRDGEEEKEQ